MILGLLVNGTTGIELDLDPLSLWILETIPWPPAKTHPFDHSFLTQAFRKVYPAVDLQINKMVTDEGRLFFGGGITADLNLSLIFMTFKST